MLSSEKDHVNYGKRVIALQRWNNNIVGESTGNTSDARADESLYKPSELGTARASIKSVKAGEEKPFDLIYSAGSFRLEAGAIVKFFMHGQGALGTTPQFMYPDLPGYLQLQTPNTAKASVICDKFRILSLSQGENASEKPGPGDLVVGPICIGFKITEGYLAEGDEVILSIGKTAGFKWKNLSGRKEFKVIIEPAENQPKRRLPEPVVIEIESLQPDRLDIVVPASHETNKSVYAAVTVRDCFDNRVNYDGPVSIYIKDRQIVGHVNQGLGRINLGVTSADAFSCRAQCNCVKGHQKSNWSLAASDLNVYFGDMHCHDFNSTAEGYPIDVYSWAKEEKRLDFLSVPVQVHRWIDNEKWYLVKHMNEYFLREGEFVTFLSFEWQHSHYGDKVIHFLGGDMPYLPVWNAKYDNSKSLYDALRQTDAFIISHHPGYKLDLHVPGTEWSTMETDIDRLVEIWSMHGSSEGFDSNDRPLIPPFRPGGAMDGLKRGLRFGIVGGSDTHTGRPGGSSDDARPYRGGFCGVWAEKLTRRSLFEAFKRRRTYALTGSRIILSFTVNGHLMGSEIPRADKYDVCADIWSPLNVACVQFLCDGEIIYQVKPDKDVCRVEYEAIPQDHKSHFYHCRVIDENNDLAVCSPVWVG